MKISRETTSTDNFLARSKKGFSREWFEIRWREYIEPPLPENYELLTKKQFFASHQSERPPFQADMYYIEAERRMIYFYEIEETHAVTKDKLWRALYWFADHGNDGGWHCRLISARLGAIAPPLAARAHVSSAGIDI